MRAVASHGAKPEIALGFVTYHPEASLVRRLEEAHSLGYRIYLFDNSPERELACSACERLSGCRYLTSGRNAGLGVGLAAIGAQAHSDGFSSLLFFDQDTVFSADTLAFIGEFHAARPELATTHSATVFNAKHSGDAQVPDRFAHRDVMLAISSGSLFYLENLRRIGWHNPSYFVDCVDYEFCLKSSNHGLLVGECSTTPGFDHETEQADHTRLIFGRSRRLRRYSLARITDTVTTSTRLLGAALASRNGRFAYAITRSLAGYLWWQLVSRVPDRQRLAR